MKNCSPVVRSEQIQTCVLIGVASVSILMASGLGISWLTGGEIHRSEFLIVAPGLYSSALFYGFDMPKGPEVRSAQPRFTQRDLCGLFGPAPFCPSPGSGKPVITAAVLPGAAITGPSPLGRGPPAAPVTAGDSYEKNRPPRTRRTGASASG